MTSISENKKLKHKIFVFANLKPSQINYKIIPLSKSPSVEHVYILRKTPLSINSENITCLSLPKFFRIRPLYWFFTAFYGVYCIKKYKTNLILNYNIFPHGFNAYLASLISKQPVIFSEINEDTIHYYKTSLFHSVIKRILRNAIIICTPGKNIAAFWENEGFDKTIQLHSTIDIHKFKPDLTQKKEYDFLFIGELDNNKRPNLILEAFCQILKKHSEATFCIIGYGDLEADLKQQIKSNSLQNNVFFIKTNDVLEYIQQSKTLIMASLTEGLPCAMMEAMSCELIVIVPPVGDITEVVSHNSNGFLYDNTLNGLIENMENTFEKHEELAHIRENARKIIVNEHSYEVATRKWDLLLNKISNY